MRNPQGIEQFRITDHAEILMGCGETAIQKKLVAGVIFRIYKNRGVGPLRIARLSNAKKSDFQRENLLN